MRNILLIAAVAGLAFAISCTNAAPPVRVENTAPTQTKPATAGHDDHADHNAPRISLADAKKDFDSGSAVFIDTHAKVQFDAQHIPGAINVPANDIEPHMNKIPKGKKLIAYCS